MKATKQAAGTMIETARLFFDNCETGNGWEACTTYCHPDATFSAQAEPLSEVDTVKGYTEWMRDLVKAMPDARYELTFFAADEERKSVCACAVFHGTHTGEGGPVPPTGKSVASDYAYVMKFDGDRIQHLTKIWNAPFALNQAGWA